MILHKKTVNDNNAAAMPGVPGLNQIAIRISQTGVNAPTIIQMLSTFPAAISSVNYLGVGTYSIVFDSSVLTTNKTLMLCTNGVDQPGIIQVQRLSNTTIRILTYDLTGAFADDLLNGASLLIQVFP